MAAPQHRTLSQHGKRSLSRLLQTAQEATRFASVPGQRGIQRPRRFPVPAGPRPPISKTTSFILYASTNSLKLAVTSPPEQKGTGSHSASRPPALEPSPRNTTSCFRSPEGPSNTIPNSCLSPVRLTRSPAFINRLVQSSALSIAPHLLGATERGHPISERTSYWTGYLSMVPSRMAHS